MLGGLSKGGGRQEAAMWSAGDHMNHMAPSGGFAAPHGQRGSSPQRNMKLDELPSPRSILNLQKRKESISNGSGTSTPYLPRPEHPSLWSQPPALTHGQSLSTPGLVSSLTPRGPAQP